MSDKINNVKIIILWHYRFFNCVIFRNYKYFVLFTFTFTAISKTSMKI